MKMSGADAGFFEVLAAFTIYENNFMLCLLLKTINLDSK